MGHRARDYRPYAFSRDLRDDDTVVEPGVLDSADAERLLRLNAAGHVAVSTPHGPHIAPVGYEIVDLPRGTVVALRTTPHSVLASTPTYGVITLEVDNLGHEHEGHWTVTARGRCQHVTDASEQLALERAWSGRPWPDGQRAVHLTITWSELVGRRLAAC